jgi:hypothetical protein
VPRFAADTPLLLEFACPATTGGRVTVSRLGTEFQVARFDAAGRLQFVTSRGRYPEARQLAQSLALGASHGDAATARF